MTSTAASARRSPSPTAMNGRPSPRLYTPASNAPRPAVPVPAARVSTAASVGPMQGVQPSANTAPSSGAVTTPPRGRHRSRISRCSVGSQPTNAAPSPITTTPSTRCSPTAWVYSSAPNPPNRLPVETNTAVNPATNNTLPASTRRRPAAAAPGGAVATPGRVAEAVRLRPDNPVT